MDYIKRIGTDRHKFKLELVMRKLKFSRHLPGKIYLSIQRGDHKMKTENLFEIGPNFQCDLKKEIVTFPALTLFYDQSEHQYQSKPGEMKVLLVKDTGEKKLIGKVNFDVAEFANQRGGTGGSSQAEEKMKIKKQVEEIPEKLRMEASIEYSVFIKFIGEASETDKSVKDVRSQSPFDKLKTFFFGNEEENKPRQPESPRRISKPQIASPKKQSKEKPQNKQGRERSRQPAVFEFDEQQQQPKKPSTKQRVNSDHRVPKPSDREKPKRKKQPEQIRDSEGEQSQIVNQTKSSKRPVKAPRTPSPEPKQQSNSLQQNKKPLKSREGKQLGSIKQQPSKDLDESRKEKPKKNLVHPKQKETLTEYDDQIRKVSNFNKSDQPNKHQQQAQAFFFDDPTTFPNNHKKDKTNNVKNEDISLPQMPKRANKDDKKIKSDKQIEKKPDISDEQQPFDDFGQKNTPSVASPNRRVKENSIQINSKDIQKQIQKKKRQQNSNKQIVEPPSIPKDIKPQRPKSKQGRLPQPAIKKKQQKTQQQQQINVNSSQVKNMFVSFDEPATRQFKASAIKPKNINANESNIFIKEELEKKQKDLADMRYKLEGLQKMERRLREEQSLRQAAEKTVAHLKEQNSRLEKDLARVREEYNTLRSEHESQSSIFRATQDHFLNNSEQQDIQQENKRLEREKNEMIVNMSKQKERHAKEVKAFREELQKERMKYKQLENLSKIDLKKLKDQNIKLSGNVEIMKDKNKQKIRQNETLINENKTLNGQVIELKDKLGALKLKICEKLNEANEHGESELMEVLTELCEDM